MSSWQTTFYKTKVKPYERYEREAAERIQKLNKLEIVSFCNDNKYDFIDSLVIKYEVKYDRASNNTGNFYIEYNGYGKLSGISTTEAQYYIITDGINYYLIRTDKLKSLCAQYGVIRTTKDLKTFGCVINCDIVICHSLSI